MELKWLSGEHMAMGQISSNRTFMELKSRTPATREEPPPRSNRTFMELKCESTGCTCSSTEVLIVPLWN